MQNVVFLLFRRLRAPLITLVTVYAVAVLGLVLIPGMNDQGQPWRMDFLHAIYFVSFMGSTIGFGEIPYPFTPGQRMWTTLAIYASVIAWLYAIGALFATLQDPAFRRVLARSRFMRGVRRIREPFYLICGYGDTGNLLVQAMSDRGTPTVVNDIDQAKINAVDIEDLEVPAVALTANAADPATLLDSGLRHPRCAGVIAVTDQDDVNLKIAITSKLLNPALPAICRAESHDTEANMASFGTDHIINPFDAFADRLAMAIRSPSVHLISEWMTSIHGSTLTEPLAPPKGLWIVCGYGRLGRALHRHFTYIGIPVVIAEANQALPGLPPDVVAGRGTEAVTLRDARIDEAVGIVAGTDHDANNLSIIVTAREMKPSLFTVVRQNHRSNDAVFRAAPADMIMQPGAIIARKVLALITTPLLSDFLRLARHESEEWANVLVASLSGVSEVRPPYPWSVSITAKGAPAIWQAFMEGKPVQLGTLYKDGRDISRRLRCLALLVKRGQEHYLLPEEEFQLRPGDQVLFAGRRGSARRMSWATHNYNVLNYLTTGKEQSGGYIWRRLAGRD